MRNLPAANKDGFINGDCLIRHNIPVPVEETPSERRKRIRDSHLASSGISTRTFTKEAEMRAIENASVPSRGRGGHEFPIATWLDFALESESGVALLESDDLAGYAVTTVYQRVSKEISENGHKGKVRVVFCDSDGSPKPQTDADHLKIVRL